MNVFKALGSNLKSLSRRSKHDTRLLAQWPEEPLDLPADRRGGFYPATLGDNLNSTYTIVQKLGWGQHSNVWLAKHEGHTTQAEVRRSQNIDCTRNASAMQLSDELGLLQLVREVAGKSRNPGRRHVVTLIDSFKLSSTQGNHLCLVHEVMGRFPKVNGVGLPIPLVKAVAKQLLQALDFLHHECHVIHTDLKPDNFLVKLDNVETAVELQKENLDPIVSGISPKLSRPAILSRPLRALSSGELLNLVQSPKFDVQLTDFGTAVATNGLHPELIQPFALRAPEIILGREFGTSADIWNLGCLASLIFEFLTGRWLFAPRGGPTWTAEAYHLAHMPGMAGEEFDAAYFRTAKHFGEYFNNDSKLRLQVEGKPTLEKALRNYNIVGDDELPLCISFLQSMLRLRPSDRAAATDLIQHDWLKV
ncbi:hypothetical protein BS47DRAFT_1379973 [Hydnum rufescens UP504]|uniref:non-specific serine/threonine protein kinase n=1 Tax=Hydnum rufescens UP504 TaxID=1448309 RepID=A0A9P6B5T7_9AGAM|nr:hypothetical protein BS47DRAFT_1379973 [Hydnum rufescens UP504]